jgi:protein involved in ribonucleotide reduction
MPRGSAHARSAVIAAAALLLLGGCSTWQAQHLATPSAIRIAPDASVRVMRADGFSAVLTGVRISGDTLFGTPVAVAAGQPAAPLAIPLIEVRKLEVRKADPARVAGIVLGVLGFSLLFGG